MNYLKRALHGVRYYKKNSLLLFLIFTILSTLILSGFCIRAASQETSRRIGVEIGGSVQVQAKEDPASPIEANILSRESADRIAGQKQVSESLYTNVALACAGNFFPKGPATPDTPQSDYELTLHGCNGVHPDLQERYRLLDGRRIQPGESNVALIHEGLMKEEDIKVGDTITVTSEKDGGTETTLTVVGVFMSDRSLFYFNEAYSYMENRIYTDLAAVEALTGNSALESARYTVADPAAIPALLGEIGKLELPEKDELAVVAQDGEYRKIAVSLNSLSNIATLLFTASILLGAVILTAMIMMSLSDREFEIGVLLSMGENKLKVILQLVLESLVPILLAVTAGVVLSLWASGYLGGLLGAGERGVEVRLEAFPVLLMYLCGIGLTLVASCVTAYKVLRYQPKKILMAME